MLAHKLFSSIQRPEYSPPWVGSGLGASYGKTTCANRKWALGAPRGASGDALSNLEQIHLYHASTVNLGASVAKKRKLKKKQHIRKEANQESKGDGPTSSSKEMRLDQSVRCGWRQL
jgi:hypothetical protein